MTRRLILTLILITSVGCNLNAQFRSSKNNLAGNVVGTVTGPPGSAESQVSQNDTSYVATDSLQGFSIRRMVRGFAHKDSLTAGYFFLGSAILPGVGQIYNRDYWKVPVLYTGIAAGVLGGIQFNVQYQKTGEDKYRIYRNASYIGAGLFYWGQLMDGIICYKTDFRPPVPAKSTIYSALLPGLGQAYNGDYWKIPIWWGGLAACAYFYHMNDMQYKRFKYIYQLTKHPQETGYVGTITDQQAEWYRDRYRRYRDYSIIATILVYALNIVDANVFAYMADFDVNDNIASLQIEPGVIEPLTPQTAYFADVQHNGMQPGLGLNMQLKF